MKANLARAYRFARGHFDVLLYASIAGLTAHQAGADPVGCVLAALIAVKAKRSPGHEQTPAN